MKVRFRKPSKKFNSYSVCRHINPASNVSRPEKPNMGNLNGDLTTDDSRFLADAGSRSIDLRSIALCRNIEDLHLIEYEYARARRNPLKELDVSRRFSLQRFASMFQWERFTVFSFGLLKSETTLATIVER